MKKLALSLLIFTNLVAFSIDDLRSIKKENINGDFTQSKKISGFSSEIKSSGSFSIANDEILWHTKKPIVSSVKITGDGVFILQNTQNWVKTSNHYDKSLFLNILNLDFDALKGNFDFKLNGDKSAWHLTLTPKGIIKNIFKRIEISGGEFVKSVVLIESNDDKTENRFFVK